MLVAAAAITPTVLLASGVALGHVYSAAGLLQAAGWASLVALPILTGLAAVILIALAAEGMTLRWLIYLERVARAYGRGRYSIRPIRLLQAPAEFKVLGETVAEMASAIEERDHALRAAVDEQSVLLREIHHRVRNNLQVIGSLLSLQASRSQDAKVKSALCDALVRIDAMTLSQRFATPTEVQNMVSARELLGEFAYQIQSRLGCGLDLEVEVDDFEMRLDLGARLILIAAEALLDVRRQPGEPVRCRLRLSLSEPDVSLRIDVLDGAEPAKSSDSLSPGLIDSYVRLIRGRREPPDRPAGVLAVRAPADAA